MQTLCNLQGTKDAGHEWYQLLSKILHSLGMTPNIMCKGVFVWKHIDGQANEYTYLILATDDMILATHSTKATMMSEKEFDRYFTYTKRDRTDIYFFNFRLIQIDHSISIDQTNHILQNIIKPYFISQD